MALQFPTVHLNGDSRDELVRVHASALAALDNAAELLAHCAPNMRNFYLHEEGRERFRRADMQHRARQDSLNTIRCEIEEILEHLGNTESNRG